MSHLYPKKPPKFTIIETKPTAQKESQPALFENVPKAPAESEEDLEEDAFDRFINSKNREW